MKPVSVKEKPEELNSLAPAPSASAIDGPESLPRESSPRSISPSELQIERVLEFIAFMSKSMPLWRLLDEAPKRIAKIVGADVASLYLLEGNGEELVLRGNIGFPVGARGTVRLSVGEGITGMAVKRMRPIS